MSLLFFHRLLLRVAALVFLGCAFTVAAAPRPNIIFIYADDLGYGDVGCYGATKVKTPNIDKLAKQGVRFTDAYAASGTCTPSRYAFMTGQYPWRKKGTGILPGDAKLIIDTTQPTLPGMLKQAGYKTGAVGKWHLGLGKDDLDWNKEIKPGPLEIGFDYSFIIPATVDRVPCVYMENHRVANLDPKDPIQVDYEKKIGNEPTGKEHPELLKIKLSRGHDDTIVNGISRIGFMSGGKSARWVDEDIADVFTQHAVRFIEENKEKPFFLYFATHDVHVPRVPHARFKGTSECGVRGDVIQEFDWSVGEILNTLERLKLTKNTLVIVTSDNGPVVDDGYADGAEESLNGHKPAGKLRGGKYSLFEGGTRLPFIARWPGVIQPGESSAIINQIDCFASFAALVGQTLSADAAPDSLNVLSAMLGQSKKGRDYNIENAKGNAIRKGAWKFIPANKTAKEPVTPDNKNGVASEPQLYNLDKDLGETKNVAAENPRVVEEMAALLKEIQDSPKSRKE